MKQTDVTDTDPKRIAGLTVNNSWFEAINMALPTFMDPDVMRIYRMCLDWDTFAKRFAPSRQPPNKEELIKKAVTALITKYNPERLRDQ